VKALPLVRVVLGLLCSIAVSMAVGVVGSAAADRPGATPLATIAVVDLPHAPIYWHLDTYRTRAEADAAQGPRSTVVEAFVKVWLFTLAEADWRPTTGTRVATIGPLRVRPRVRYMASYVEAVTARGFGMRRSLVLILHDAAQPWKVPITSPWAPRGLCAQK